MRTPNRHDSKYTDPVRAAILGLPGLSYSQKSWLQDKWLTIKPVRYFNFVVWYERHDHKVLLLSSLIVATSPILLLHWGVAVEYVFAIVVAGMFLVEKLDRFREQREIKVAKEEAKAEYHEYLNRDLVRR